MGTSDSPRQRLIRRDGWTIDRQLRFLDALRRNRNVAGAARSAGMSRESAYRLRNRPENALLAALWDRALASPPPTRTSSGETGGESHALRQFRAALFALKRQKSVKGHETDETDGPPGSIASPRPS